MPDNISKLYNELKETYELGSEDDFRKYLSDSKNREALRKELESEYDVGDEAAFSSYLGFGQPQQAAQPQQGSGATAVSQAAPVQQPTQQQPLYSQEDLQDVHQWNQPTPKGYARDNAGRLVTTRAGEGGSVYATPVTQTPEEQAIQQRMSQVGEIYLEPESYSFEPDAGDGKMHYSWRNGRRIGQLDPGALRFAHIGRNYSSEAYNQAEQEAAEMTDEQLIKAFNDLYSAYGKDSDNALTQGYGRDDASRMMAYATEMRYRDIGMPGHARDYGNDGKPKSSGVYHYYAAKMNPAVSSEMDAQDKMSWDDRVAYLSEALKDKQARENVITIGRGTDEDRKALEEDKRKLLAGSMLYARDNGRFPEEAYNVVVGAASNATPTDTGFWNGFKSTFTQMWRDVKYFSGEAANLIADDRGDVIDAIKALDKYGVDAETKLAAGTLSNMGLLGMLLFDGDEKDAAEGAGRILHGCIVRDKDGRIDIDATRAALIKKLKNTYSWGDRTMRDNVFNTAMATQTEGDAAWWGQNVAQLVPSAAAVVVGVTTRNPALAEAVGQIGMGYMCISSGSNAMQEARLYGATDGQVWTAGIVNAALEYATERVPFDRYTKRVFGEVKATSARKLMDAVVDVNNPAHHEIQQLLTAARKELGNGKLAKAYAGDILAEGTSEFAAGTLQKAAEILYKNPEDYPTFMEILEEGIESFKGGAAMGGIMGSISTGATYFEADNRRKKAGAVTVGIYDSGDGMGVPIEIVGQDSNGNYVAIDGQHKEVIVKPEEVQGVTTFSYDEWKKGEAQHNQDQSFSDGYNASDDEQAGVKDRLDTALAVLSQKGYDDRWIDFLDNRPVDEIIDHLEKSGLSDDIDAVMEYINARTAYEGMLQHVQDDMEGAIAESEAAVDQQTHIETGAVHHAVLKTGGEVWVVGGNVALTPEGNIDIENSDGDLIVLDPATGGKRMIHISDLASADEPVMADQLKQEAAATIQETMAQAAADRIDGVIQAGGEYNMLSDDNTNYHVTVLEKRDDGTVLLQVDGEEVPYVMAQEMAQQWVDNARAAAIASKVEQEPVIDDAPEQDVPVDETDMPEETEPVEEVPTAENKMIPDEVDEADSEPMPVDDNGDVDWLSTTPERGYEHLYNENGLSQEEADNIVKNSIADAEATLKKVSGKKPKPGTAAQLPKYNADKEAYEANVAAAQVAVDYWNGVKAVRDQLQAELVRAQAEERAARDAAERQAAIEAEQQYQAEQAAKKREEAERGPFTVGTTVTDKWNSAPKVDGVRDQITLADGTTIAGHYVLVEAGAATPSHDPANGWKASEGFPFNENGGTVNDRDYERDQAAQDITSRMSETYDSRAAQSVPVVTNDGVVLSGNGRTIAGDLAAQAGTDGAYIDYIKEFGGKYGFSAEQVGAMQHPRVLFIPDKSMFYTPETFAMFNAQEMKGQNLTETAVKLGKTVQNSTFNDVVGLINRFDTMTDFYADDAASAQAINMLLQSGVINPMQFAQMFDGDKVSGQGKEMLENLLLGKAFEGNPDAIRQLTEMPSVRQQIVSSLAEIANNSALSDYSLEDAIAQAIGLVYQARKGGIKQGDTVTNYARQLSLFPSETGATVADYRNAMVLLLGDILNGKAKNTLKYILTLYNRNAAEAASGQMDLFSGAVKDPETILKETIDFINQSSKNELKQEIKQATSERKAAAESGGEAEGGEQTEPATERSEAGRGTDAAVTEAASQTDTNPSEGQKEAGNYKKGHVKIDGFDVTIEQPKGSVRSGVDASGKAWSQEMHNTYGYIRGTEGVDGDHIDVFLSDHLDSWNGMVYVVDQVNKDGSFDEHKVMYGFDSEQEARDAYLSNYEEGWTGLGNITGVTRDEFKKWVDSSHRKTKPFAEYKSVNAVEEPTADNGGTAAANGTSQHELAAMLAEEFKGEIEQAKARVEIVTESAEEGGLEAEANVTVDGQPSNIWLVSGAGRTMDEYWKLVCIHFLDSEWQEIGDLADAYNEARGKEVCHDDADAKRINFNSIDEAVAFERWRSKNEEKRAAAAEATEPVQSTDTGDQAERWELAEANITERGRNNQYGVYLEIGNTVSFYIDGIIHHGDIIDFDGDDTFTIREWISKRNGEYRDIQRTSWQIPRLYGKQKNKAADIEAGGAVVDQLKSMGVDVSTDISEYRKTLSDAKKDNSEAGTIKYMRTSDGTTYGFVYRGKINLDPRKIDAELPLHEYGHLWGEALRIIAPDKWRQVVEVLKGDADTWNFLKERKPELTTDDAIADEMIAEFSGKNGEQRLKEELERLSQTNADYKTKWGNIYKNIVKAIQDFWKQVGDFLHIDYKSPQQVYDQVLKDFASGMNPRAKVEKYLKERDAEFVDAVNRGDMEGATRLFNDALTAEVGNGMTPFVSVGGYGGKLRDLARKVKRGDKAAIDEVAKLMASIIPKDAVLIPAPSHTGRATYMLDVANAIAKITGCDVADVLRGTKRAMQYEQKKQTGKAITSAEMGVTVDGELPAGKVPVVLDNVVATGNTAEACVQALGKGIVCSLTKATDQYDHVASLKSANVVVRDSKGDVIPLSKRFDLSQSKRLGNIQFSKSEGGAEAVSNREAALRDGLVEVLRGAGIEVVTDVEEGQRVLDAVNGRVQAMGFANSREEFDNTRDRAVAETGIVMTGLAEEEVTVVDVPRHDFTGVAPIKQAEAWGKKNLVTPKDKKGNYIDKPKLKDGTEYSISSNAIGKFLSKSATKNSDNLGVHLSVLKKLKDVIHESMEAEVHPDYKKDETGKRDPKNGYNPDYLVHRLYGAVDIDGKTYRVKTTIIENGNESRNYPHSYEVTEIELLDDSMAGSESRSVNIGREGHDTKNRLSNNSITGAKLLQGVEKSYDPGKKLLDESEKSTESGVNLHRVWHGSGAEFDSFDHSHMGEGEGAQAYGWGTYVTEVEDIGRRYAETAGGVRYKGHDVDELYEHSIDGMEDSERNAAWMLSRAMRTFGFSDAVERLRSLYKQDLEKSNRLKGLSIEQTMERYGCSRADAKRYIKDAAAKADMWQQRLDALEGMREEDFTAPSRVLYEVEIPEEAGAVYLDHVALMKDQPDVLESVDNALTAQGWRRQEIDDTPVFTKGEKKIILSDGLSGGELYLVLEGGLGSDRAASEFLHEAGVTGIVYPSNYLGGGNRMGSKNYVIFNEADAQITGREKFFRTADGTAYGFVKDGRIYIDPRIATSETPVHEYTHLWCAALRRVNPAAWARLKEALLGQKDVLEHVKKLYPELEGDELMDEVFAHYSGRRGADRLHREEEAEMAKADGVLNKARIKVIFDKIRKALTRFWELSRDLFAGKVEGIEKLSAEDFADMAMADLLRGFNGGKTAVHGTARQERTLMGVHNITQEKLRSALKLGGLANPSMAVIDTSVSGFDSFGDISLIPDADLIASKTGRNAGTWGADAYSPRFPETHRRLGKGGDKKMREWIKSLGMRKEMVFNTEEQFNDYYNSFNIRDNALVYPFLHEKGLSDQVDYYTHKNVDSRLEDDLREANGDAFVLLKRFDDDDEYKKKITDIVVGDEVGKISRKDGENFQEFRDRRRAWAKQIREALTEEDGFISRHLADDLLYSQARAYRENGKFNEGRTLVNAEEYIRDNGLQEEYQQYFEQKMQELGAETQIYAGSDSQGRSKFKPADLDQISRQMKKQGRAGAEGGIFEDSPGAIRAKLLNPMKTLDQIRKEKNRIVDHEQFEQAREQYQEELREYADRYTRGSAGALADIITSGNMVATAQRYNISLDADAVADLNEFKSRIRQLPTEYFETKFERPVMLEEFRKVVVPDDLPLDLYGALDRAGLEIVEYKSGDKDDRRRKMLAATKDAPGIRFHFVGEKGASQADKSDSGNRMDNRAIAEQMEQAGKDARNIKLATGWERGADGKWRYEIMDFDDVDVIGNLEWLERHPDAKRVRELIHKINANLFGMGEPLTKAEQAEYAAIVEKWHGALRFDKPFKNPDRLTLQDYVKADELFAAYPELREMPVKFEELDGETRGVYRPHRKEIAISVKLRYSKDGLRNELLHEVQHAIQHIEGFASGSSEQLVRSAWDNIHGINKTINRLADSLGYQDWIKTLTPEKINAADDLRRKGRWFNLMYVFAKDNFKDPDVRDKFIKKLDEANDVIAENKQVTGDGLTAYQAYRASAGEVEARNVQSRSNMSREERRVSLAENTEDIPRDKQTVWTGFNGESVMYDIRRGPAPQKTGVGYKVFVLKDGKLYPPMVANPGGEATPFGLWLNADAAPVAGTSKTGRPKVKAGGKGTQGGSGQLAYRPGWHLGEIPYALQFNRDNKETGASRELFPANFVWAEVEYADDVDYQDEAMSYGMNASGKFQHSLAGLPRVPENGSYRYRTNPNPETDPWIITGAMKVKRILKPSEVDEMVRTAGREPQKRQSGAITDEQVEALNQQLRENIAQYNDTPEGSVAGETGNIYHTKDGKQVVYRSLFEDLMPENSLFGNQQQETRPARPMTDAERIQAMSDEELLRQVSEGDVDTGERNFYSDEYDRRHIKDYNRACDEIQARLERELPYADRLLELLQDATRQWEDGAYKDERRSGVLAAIDTISRALDEEGAELPSVEDDNLYRDEDIDWDAQASKEELAEHLRNIPDRVGIKPSGITTTISDDSDLEALRGVVEDALYKDIVKNYNNPKVFGCYDHESGMIIVFTNKVDTRKEAESTWWHEKGHLVYDALSLKDKEECGRAAMDWLHDHGHLTDDQYNHYSDADRGTEGAAWLVKYLFENFGTDGILYGNFTGNGKITKLAAAIQNYLKNGEENDNNRLRQPADGQGANEGRSQAFGTGAQGPRGRLNQEIGDVDDGTIGAYNRAVNTIGKVINVAGRDVKPRMTRYNFQEAFQDAILSVKKLQQVVCEAHGLDKLPSKEDAWTYENRLSSINMHARKHFIEKLYEPMMKAHDKLVKHGATVDEITEYVICKHGLERNQVFAERDAQRDADEIARNGGVPDIDALRDQYRQRDYSGLTSITGLDNIADIEADAQRRVDEFEQKHGQLCDELWSRINDATKWTLRRSYDGGMMSAQTYIKVRDMFQYYVPLRGWDETTAEDVYDYIMGDRGAFNGTLKTAMGRTSLADDPFATIGNMGESAIVQGNRNHLKQHLWNMATQHPTDVCQVRDMWVVLDAQGEWIADFPEIPEDADADTIAMILDDHETAMLDLESQDLAKRVRNNLDVGYRIDQRYIPEHAVVVMMNGDRHVVYINGNPRAAQAINGNLSSDKGSKNAIRRLADFFFKDTRRYYSSVVTSYNINFSGANFVRDLPHAYAMTFTKYGWRKAAKYIVKSFQCIPWVIKNQAGYSGNSNMDQLFREFVAYGGVTGYAHINDIDSWKADNRRRMARLNALGKGTVGTLKGIKAVIHAVGWFSETLELIPRFTTYCASRDMGMDIQSSIKEAKDITTNFNKKGTEMTPGVWGAVANVLRYEEMFFNPIVQGMYQWFDVAKDSKAAKMRLAGVMLWMPVMGALVPYLNQFLLAAIGGDDDDDYFLQNEFTRRQNMLLWTGKGYAKIPIAPVFRELYGIGETIATRMCGRIDDRKTATDLVDQLRAAFSLEGQSSYREWSFARAAFPDHYGPIIDIMNNENFTGKSLWYESEWTKNKPEYTKAKESTWSPLVEASRKINGWLGGDDDIKADASGKWLNPVVWQHLLTNYGGGFAQVIGDASSTINNLAHGEVTDVSQWPIAKRFYTQPTEKRANWARYGIYKQYEIEFNKAKDKFAALKKRGLSPLDMAKEISEFAQRHPKAVGVYASWNGGINGADYVQKLKDLREKGDDAAYWATLKEAVEKADYAMRTGYAKAWEQKRPSRPEFLDDDELHSTFDNSENDSVRAVMAKEIATRGGVQDYFSHDPYENYGDEATAYWNTYRRLRISEDVVEDGKASQLLDDNEKETLKKIKKQLGQGGDDEQIMDEYRRERRRLIEEHDNE